MRKRLYLLTMILAAAPTLALAHPFRTRFVCVPSVAPNQMNLKFKIRDSGQCVEGELYLEVQPQADGSVFLLPAQPEALSPEQKQDFDKYRRYFGGEGNTSN